MMPYPILWSFRRCPYAMRARLAVVQSGVPIELREILLRDKPEAFLEDSPSATVPCLRTEEGVIDESLDVMIWALKQNDPDGLLDMSEQGWSLIRECDGPFKAALDRTKYPTRYEGIDIEAEREKASDFLYRLNDQLAGQVWLFGDRATLADYAILPFVRQFAHIDRACFDDRDWPYLIAWLDRFLESDLFAATMHKYAPWTEAADRVIWP